MTSLGPNRTLIGRQGSRHALNGPALLLDLDAFERNLAAMADHARRAGLALRPHAKAHKSGPIGRRQIEAGAIGISCANLDEAETMARHGIGAVLVTSPVVGSGALDRLMALASSVDEIIVVADHPANVDAIAARATEAGRTIDLVVDFDVGQHRTGVTGERAAVDLAGRIATAKGVRYRGVQAYYGHLQHVARYADRRLVVHEQLERLRATIKALGGAGLSPGMVTGGGTGTFHIDAAAAVHTELQPGSYPFMDRQYHEVELTPDGPPPFAQALFVQATVVSVNQPGLAVVHGGWKAFATESGLPLVARGAPKDATYAFMGDEHGGLRLPAGSAQLELGAVVEFVPPHCDPTVNLFNRFHCVRGGDLVDIWPIEARGY